MNLLDFAVWVIQVLLILGLLLFWDYQLRRYIDKRIHDEVTRILFIRPRKE